MSTSSNGTNANASGSLSPSLSSAETPAPAAALVSNKQVRIPTAEYKLFSEARRCLWTGCMGFLSNKTELLCHMDQDHVGVSMKESTTCQWEGCGVACSMREHMMSHIETGEILRAVLTPRDQLIDLALPFRPQSSRLQLGRPSQVSAAACLNSTGSRAAR